MKSLVLVATLAFVAVQLIRAAPAPEDEKKELKEAAVAASPGGVADATPIKAEVKPEVAGLTHVVENASVQAVRDATVHPAEPAEKAQ